MLHDHLMLSVVPPRCAGQDESINNQLRFLDCPATLPPRLPRYQKRHDRNRFYAQESPSALKYRFVHQTLKRENPCVFTVPL